LKLQTPICLDQKFIGVKKRCQKLKKNILVAQNASKIKKFDFKKKKKILF
jgi:hypothetical protein